MNAQPAIRASTARDRDVHGRDPREGCGFPDPTAGSRFRCAAGLAVASSAGARIHPRNPAGKREVEKLRGRGVADNGGRVGDDRSLNREAMPLSRVSGSPCRGGQHRSTSKAHEFAARHRPIEPRLADPSCDEVTGRGDARARALDDAFYRCSNLPLTLHGSTMRHPSTGVRVIHRHVHQSWAHPPASGAPTIQRRQTHPENPRVRHIEATQRVSGCIWRRAASWMVRVRLLGLVVVLWRRCRVARVSRYAGTRVPGSAGVAAHRLAHDDCAARLEPGDRHAERRARDVVQAHLLEEVDGLRVASVLAADPAVQVGPR